jgi:phospholipid N-methyltransferase
MKWPGRVLSGVARAVSALVGKPRVMRVARALSWLSREANARIHALNFLLHWSLPPAPEWQDQYTTLHYLWRRDNKPDLAERGCMNLLGIAPGATVLELCAGDGFFTRHFHAARAKTVVAVDFDTEVVAHARRYNAGPNISYDVLDIRTSLPEGSFDNVIWNGAIEHFKTSELDSIMAGIKVRLVKGGLLSGYTVAEIPGNAQLSHHELEFRSPADLGKLLSRYFPNVRVVESRWPPTVHNLYFFASDGPLPCDNGWKSQ